MTTDEKRIAVAGWMKLDVKLCPVHLSRSCCGRDGIPPLTLDWLHECWLKLSETQKDKFCDELYRIMVPEVRNRACYWTDWTVKRMINATAEQRLSALVETLGLGKGRE